LPNQNLRPFIIGTRGSLLALTQCGQVRQQLESLSGRKFELKIIKTQGDQLTGQALWQLPGKDFFTKELDDALLGGQVDLVVHSLKDLGSERPAGIKLQAITKRQFSHDILLIPEQHVATLCAKEWQGKFVVGTSSPRRIANVTADLKKFLPHASQAADFQVTTEILRGNVNTRIEKLRRGDFHAIVLALAGIERLSLDEKSTQELLPLVRDLNFMILPRQTFPSAAGQGALGIECLEQADQDLKNILIQMHCKNTATQVKHERKIFASYGGGCHLPLGINILQCDSGNELVQSIKGSWQNSQYKKYALIRTSEIEKYQRNPNEMAFVGLARMPQPSPDHYLCDQLFHKEAIEDVKSGHVLSGDVLVSTAYAIGALNDFKRQNRLTPQTFIWASGEKTHQKLAREGFWVNGTGDVNGEEDVNQFLSSKLLKLIKQQKGINPSLNTKYILSNAESSSQFGEIIPTYTRRWSDDLQKIESMHKILQTINVFYWSSFAQYEIYCHNFPFIKTKRHCCGTGKTLKHFSQKNINVTAFTGVLEFCSWFEGE